MREIKIRRKLGERKGKAMKISAHKANNLVSYYAVEQVASNEACTNQNIKPTRFPPHKRTKSGRIKMRTEFDN